VLWYISTARRRLQHDAHRFGRALSLILHSCALPSRTQWLHGLEPSHFRLRTRQNSHALLVRLPVLLVPGPPSKRSGSSDGEDEDRPCPRLCSSVPDAKTPEPDTPSRRAMCGTSSGSVDRSDLCRPV